MNDDLDLLKYKFSGKYLFNKLDYEIKMFLTEESYKKYSLLGNFENQIKYTLFNLNNETKDSKFEVLPYLNYCESINTQKSLKYLIIRILKTKLWFHL